MVTGGGGRGARGTRVGRDLRGVWDRRLSGTWERRGQGVRLTARREARNGGGGQPAGRGAASGWSEAGSWEM